jgi:hypothetical protein
MPYVQEISRTNPSCFVILVDQSASMREYLDNKKTMTKAEAVADAINRLLQNLVSKSTKSEGIRDYYEIAVVGYGGGGVKPAWSGSLANRTVIPISLIGNSPLRVEQRTKETMGPTGEVRQQRIHFPVWLEPKSAGDTPMVAGLNYAHTLLKNWLAVHPNCFPPIVINISDGESSDGNPQKVAWELMKLCSSDGNVLIFNLHISNAASGQIIYPDNDEELADDHAKLLFSFSSTLTPYMRRVLQDEGYKVSANTRGFGYNADFSTLIRFLDVGTRPSIMLFGSG